MTRKSFKPEFRITVDDSSTARMRSIEVAGELDSGTCEDLIEAFERTVDDAKLGEVRLNLRGVTFIDSAGMRAMIVLERSAGERGIRLVVLPPPDEVTELLRIAGVADRLNLARAPGDIPASEFTERVELDLRPDRLAPSRARAEVRETMAGLLDDAELANLVLLTSELVTNAIIHPDCPDDAPIALHIAAYPAGVRVEVDDPGEGFDPAAPVSSRGGGHGLFLVDRCAARWGAQRVQTERGARFRVWFELEPGAPGAAAAAGE